MFPFIKRNFAHLNKISISKSALIHNFHQLQNHNPQALVCPVLKSNAYGHGLKLVAPIFESLKAPFLCVDSLFEAWQLQSIGIQTPILLLGFTLPDNFKTKSLPFHIPLFDLETAQILNKFQKGISVHLKIDTGMSRFGVKLSDLDSFCKELTKLPNLNITGVYSHFSSADENSKQIKTQNQIMQFKKALQILEKYNMKPQWRHISASAGSYFVKDPIFNLIRTGIAVYGIAPSKDRDNLNLHPALEFSSTICQIKQIRKGDTVGYSDTFIAKQSMTIGIIGAGYYEGIDRRLSNKGFITVDGVDCQILGKVCMNITIIDLSEVKHPHIGQKCIIYSFETKDTNLIFNCSQKCHTIPYELLAKLNESVRREVIE